MAFNLGEVLAAGAAAPLAKAPRTIDTITKDILDYKVQGGEAILGIGRCLIEAKELLPHGEWLPWLTEQVEFTERQAQRFMRLAREWSNPTALSDLGATKALQLLSLPTEEREKLMEEQNVIDMSSRELEQAIRERGEALAAQKAAEAARDQMAADMKVANDLLAAAKQASEEAAEREQTLLKELEELRARPIEVVGAAVPDADALDAARQEGAAAAKKEAEEALRAKLDKAKSDAKDAREKLEQAKAAAQEVERRMTAQLNAEKERADALEKKLRMSGSKDLSTFAVYFETVQENYNRLLGCLVKVGQSDGAEDHDKLVDAVTAMLASFSDRLPRKVGEAS